MRYTSLQYERRPLTVIVAGTLHTIPPKGDYYVSTMTPDPSKKRSIRRDHVFNSTRSSVLVTTYEFVDSYVSGDPGPGKVIGQGKIHLKHFLPPKAQDIPEEQEDGPPRNADGYPLLPRAPSYQGFFLPDSLKHGLSSSPPPPPIATPQEKLDMSDLVTGMRVKFPDPRNRTLIASGTIVECKEGVPKDRVLVCLDVPLPEEDAVSDIFGIASEICGIGYGHMPKAKEVIPYAPASANHQRYNTVPEHVGVVVVEPFSYQGVAFPRNSVGRVLGVCEISNTMSIAWLNVLNCNFSVQSDGKMNRANVWNVPNESLRWCNFQPGSYKVKRTWYTTFSSLTVGDYLVYTSEKPITFPANSGKFSHVVTPGVVFQHEGWDQERCCIRGAIAAGMPQETFGQNMNLRKQDVKKFDGVFLPAGKTVEVVAEVSFKKKNLQGYKARIVLPTDSEGDVGLQFSEDMGAGSLDGAGLEGHCLYIPSKAVKLVSE